MQLDRVPYLTWCALQTLANNSADGEEGEKRHFDQKEGRKAQPPPTAASVLITISFCMQLDSAWGRCWFKCKSWNKTLATGQFRVVESGCRPFSIYLGKGGCESESGGYLGAESAPFGLLWQLFRARCLVAWAKPESGLGPNNCVFAFLGGESLHAGKLPDTFLLTPGVSMCVLEGPSKISLAVYLALISGVEATLAPFCAVTDSKDLAVRIKLEILLTMHPAKQGYSICCADGSKTLILLMS